MINEENKATNEAQPSTQFETETCSRCGGSGHYSYCQMWGTTCFKCAGAKRVYTKKGAAAKAYYDAMRSKPASEFKVGELIYVEPGPFNKGGFTTVLEVKDGGEVTCTVGDTTSVTKLITIDTKLINMGTSPDTLYKFGLTAEQKTEFKKLAFAYQDTLTKQGKPRKR